MTLSTKIEVFTDFTFVRRGLHTCTAVAHSLCVSWAFLYLYLCWMQWTSFFIQNRWALWLWYWVCLTAGNIKPIWWYCGKSQEAKDYWRQRRIWQAW